MARARRRPIDPRRRKIGMTVDPATWQRFCALARALGTSGAALAEFHMVREIALAECDPFLRERMDEIEPQVVKRHRKVYKAWTARTRPDRRWSP